MRFENHFDVDAPLERVWAAVLDVERVAPTVPGAQVLERTGADAYKVAIKVKVGPMSMTYRGEVEITERDDAAHRAVFQVKSREKAGGGAADADVTFTLAGDGGTVATAASLRGKVASMGEGMVETVLDALITDFTQRLASI